MTGKTAGVAVVRHQTEATEQEQGGLIDGSVTMSRALAQSAHGLTLNEARVMMLASRLIDPRKSPYYYAKDGYVKVRVTAAEFAQMADQMGHAGAIEGIGRLVEPDQIGRGLEHGRQG